MATIISFVSQKGGVGKTTSAVNMATAFAIGGYSVLLIDLDPQSSIRYSIGINEAVPKGTRELFLNPDLPAEDLIHKTDLDNMDFILSNIETVECEKAVSQKCEDASCLHNRIKDIAERYDIVIVDAPSSTNNLSLTAIYSSDLLIMPLQCESLAIKSLKRFLSTFRDIQRQHPDKDLKLAGILLTMYDRKLAVHRKVAKQIVKTLSDSVFETIVPRNESIVESSALGKSVITYNLNSIGATAYVRLMNEIVDKFSLR